MIPINDTELQRQHAQQWSGQLGELAAAQPANIANAKFSPLGASPVHATPPTQLSAILAYFRHRHMRQEHAADNLKANKFMVGD